MTGRGDGDSKARSGELGALRWALTQRTNNARATLLLIKIAKQANGSFEGYMSVRRMAEQAECHERSVQRYLRILIGLELIEDISHRYPKRRTNTYLLLAPIIPR